MGSWSASWGALAALVAGRLAELRWNQFLIADYGSVGASGCGPYAQTSRQPSGFYCEAAGRDVVGHRWELDASALELQGWFPPDASTGNWWRVTDSSELEAAELLLRSLVDAWGCVDPGLVSLTVGQHPPRGGGEPQPLARDAEGRLAA